MPRSSQARLRSSSGMHSSDWLLAIPTEEITTLDDATFQCADAKRLGFHILATGIYCEGCGHRMHASGYHRMNCVRIGRLQYRHKPLVTLWGQNPERSWRSCPEKEHRKISPDNTYPPRSTRCTTDGHSNLRHCRRLSRQTAFH